MTSLLSSTLQQRWRRWNKERKRTAKQLQRLHNADVVFVSPAKSGRTWVRVMLSHVYHRRYGVPVDMVVELDNMHVIESRIPKFYFTHDINDPPKVRRRLNVASLPGKAFVLLVRDPRDVAVSRFFQFSYRQSAEKRRRRGLPDEMGDNPVIEFLLDEEVGLPVVIETMNKWRGEIERADNGLLMRYEDLHRDAHTSMTRLLAFLRETGELEEDVRAAVDFAAFETMRKREEEGFWSAKILRPGAPDNPNSFKARRGKVGGYREELSPEHVELLDRMVQERLHSGLSYRAEEKAATSSPLPSEIPASAEPDAASVSSMEEPRIAQPSAAIGR